MRFLRASELVYGRGQPGEGTMSRSERMSSVDTTWLRMDSPGNLMMIVGVWILEGPVALDRVEKQIADGLMSYRRYRQKVDYSAGRRLLARRPDFDLAHHIKRVNLPGRGGKRGVRALRRRTRLGAARSQPSALDGAYRGKIRGRRGRGVPHASCDRRRRRADGRHHGAGRRARRTRRIAPTSRTRTKAGCRA